MKYPTTPPICFLLLLFSITFAQEKTTNEINIKFDKDLAKLAAEINSHCPYMLDVATRLDSAGADTLNNFTYSFTLVKQELSNLDPAALQDGFKKNIIAFIKMHPDMAGFIENRVTLFYRYFDKNGAFVTVAKIAPEDYLDDAKK